jgi:uncharacterized membrane protein
MITKLSDIDAPVAAAGGVRCYVDICIARSTEMAFVGLPFFNVSSKTPETCPLSPACFWVRTKVNHRPLIVVLLVLPSGYCVSFLAMFLS